MIMSAVNFLEQRLEKSNLMRKASLFEPHKVSNAIKKLDHQVFLHYGREEVGDMIDGCPDLDKDDGLSGWIAVKYALASMDDLDKEMVLTVLPELCQLNTYNHLDADDC